MSNPCCCHVDCQSPHTNKDNPKTTPLSQGQRDRRYGKISAGTSQCTTNSPANSTSYASNYEHDTTSTQASLYESTADPASPPGTPYEDRAGSGFGSEPTASAADAPHRSRRPSELDYQLWYGKEIEAWVSEVERRAARNPNLYLQDGVTLNPARAPYVSLGGGAAAGGTAGQGCDTGEPFWRWSILIQRWIHEDKENDVLHIYPKQLMR